MVFRVPSQRCCAVLRTAAPSRSAAASVPCRALSTTVYRPASNPFKPRDAQSSDSSLPVRRNPLIGNFAPAPAAAAKPAPSRDERDSPSSSSSPQNTTASSSILSSLPPRPPPRLATTPPNSSTLQGSEMASKKLPQHPYTAASSSSSPFNIDIASIIASKSAAYSASLGSSAATDPQRQPQIRSDAAKGRTVFISTERKPGTSPNVQAAMRTLNRLNREDFVKQKYNSQREHERKGLKRKRLRSERWKSRFKMSFKAAAERVIYLKRQGW